MTPEEREQILKILRKGAPSASLPRERYFDHEDGSGWIGSDEHLPICCEKYSTSPIFIATSLPCKVKTKDGRIAKAVRVYAIANMPRNNGKRRKWEGWVEVPEGLVEKNDRSFVENIFKGDTVDVLRWHYYKNFKED